MKMKQVLFDEDETPTEFTVTMSLDELALLYRLAGHLAPIIVSEATGDNRWGNKVLHELGGGAAGILNTFYENGADDVIPRFNLYADRS